MSTIYIECPKRPPRTMFDMVGLIRPHSEFSPVKPAPNAGEIAWRRYRNEVAREAELHAAQKAKFVEPCRAPMFICGDIEPEPFCACGHTSEMLCDHPMGNGGTCDLNLCWCCGRHVGDDMDLCRIHFAEFAKRTGAEQVNPWPPPRKDGTPR
jgi:hypothetical protein